MTIFKYIRLSSEDDDLKEGEKLESNSIVNQRNLINTYIQSHDEFAGAKVVEFCDDGWSGKNFERPAVKEMLDQAIQQKAQCIIVKDISRFGRDYIIAGNYITRVFPFLGVRFIAINDGLDSNRIADVDSLETAFKTLLYDLYSRDLSRKVRNAKRFRAQQGEWLSAIAPYGYMRDTQKKNHMVIDPPAAEVVCRIFKMIAEGLSTVQVAKILNQECVPTPMLYKQAQSDIPRHWNTLYEENFWTDSAIIRIVRDEQYLGKVVYGKRFYDQIGQGHSLKVSKKDWIVVDGMHEEIVTQEEFDRAQAALREFSERAGWSCSNPLSKKVRCGICGHAMVREDVKRPYFFCRTSRMAASFSCSDERVPESDIVEIILAGLHAQAVSAVRWGKIWEARHQKKKTDFTAIQKQIATLKEACVQGDSQIKELYETLVSGDISKDEYRAAKAVLVSKRDHAKARIAELENALANADSEGKLNNPFVTSFQKYAEVTAITKEMVTDVLKEVRIYPGGRIEVAWNYCEDLERLLRDLHSEGSEQDEPQTGMDLLQDCVS